VLSKSSRRESVYEVDNKGINLTENEMEFNDDASEPECKDPVEK